MAARWCWTPAAGVAVASPGGACVGDGRRGRPKSTAMLDPAPSVLDSSASRLSSVISAVKPTACRLMAAAASATVIAPGLAKSASRSTTVSARWSPVDGHRDARRWEPSPPPHQCPARAPGRDPDGGPLGARSPTTARPSSTQLQRAVAVRSRSRWSPSSAGPAGLQPRPHPRVDEHHHQRQVAGRRDHRPNRRGLTGANDDRHLLQDGADQGGVERRGRWQVWRRWRICAAADDIDFAALLPSARANSSPTVCRPPAPAQSTSPARSPRCLR